MKNFDKVIPLLLKDEGGYSNDPNDAGGPTNFGITLTDYRKYIKSNGTANDVRNMTVDQAKTIYKTKYWDALSCDTLPNGVDYTCFDYGVNSGLGRPRNALKKFPDKKGADLINAINDERMAFLTSIGHGHNAGFLRGWTNRVARVRTTSLNMAKSSAGTVTGTAGGAVVAGGAAMAGTPHHYWPWIIGGIVASLVIAGVIYLVHEYKKQGILNAS